MKETATHEDANLILRLYELRREETMRRARTWIFEKFAPANLEDFQRLCPMGSQENAYFRMVLGYWDMAAGFVTRGILNQELFAENNGEMLVVWERVKPIIAALRESMKNPHIGRHIEQVHGAMVAWMKQNAPGAYEALQERTAPPKAAAGR